METIFDKINKSSRPVKKQNIAVSKKAKQEMAVAILIKT